MQGDVYPSGEGLFFGIPQGATLFATNDFFEQAIALLKKSTQLRKELAGAVIAREEKGRCLRSGLQERQRGEQKYVSVSADWGSLLWHTHPGLSGTIAAFSEEDLQVIDAVFRKHGVDTHPDVWVENVD